MKAVLPHRGSVSIHEEKVMDELPSLLPRAPQKRARQGTSTVTESRWHNTGSKIPPEVSGVNRNSETPQWEHTVPARAVCLWGSSPAQLPSSHLAVVSGKAPLLPTWLLKHQHGLRGRVDRQRARPLHRAVAPAGHAVTAPRVGKPQVLWGANTRCGCKAKPSVPWV